MLDVEIFISVAMSLGFLPLPSSDITLPQSIFDAACAFPAVNSDPNTRANSNAPITGAAFLITSFPLLLSSCSPSEYHRKLASRKRPVVTILVRLVPFQLVVPTRGEPDGHAAARSFARGCNASESPLAG